MSSQHFAMMGKMSPANEELIQGLEGEKRSYIRGNYNTTAVKKYCRHTRVKYSSLETLYLI